MPEVGERKRFPNGAEGEWDGTGWAQAPERSLGGFAENVINSGVRFAKSINPITAVPNMLRLAKGVAEMTIPGVQSQDEVAAVKTPGAMGGMLKERYGGAQNIGDTFYNDPVGAAADISTVLGGGAGLLKATGTLPKLARAATIASDATNPLFLPAKAAKTALRGIGSGVVEATVRPPAEVKKQQHRRFEASRTIADNFLHSPEKASMLGKRATSKVDELAAASPATTTAKELTTFDKTLGSIDRQTLKNEDLDALASFAQQVEAENPGPLSMSRTVEIRRNENRLANAEHRAAGANMPTGERPVIGDAHKELASDASRIVHERVPGTEFQDDIARRMILAEGAVKAGRNRPHIMSKLMAAGALGGASAAGYGGYALPAVATYLAMDSPLAGTVMGSGLWKIGNAVGNDAALRAALMARLAQPERK
jgi:hypothetical protein